jgi:hypothetical protein
MSDPEDQDRHRPGVTEKTIADKLAIEPNTKVWLSSWTGQLQRLSAT